MENDKDIKIETEEDVGLDDKIKAGARALGKKIEDPDRDTGAEYEAEKAKERVVDWYWYTINLSLLIPTVTILATLLTFTTFIVSTFAQSEGTNETMKNADESANQTGENMQQGANKTGEAIQGNASEMGSKITEGAKNLAENIGEKLQDLAK